MQIKLTKIIRRETIRTSLAHLTFNLQQINPKIGKRTLIKHVRVSHTSSTLGTAIISEKAKREGCEVASTTTFASAGPLRIEACFTKNSMCSACFSSISISQIVLI